MYVIRSSRRLLPLAVMLLVAGPLHAQEDNAQKQLQKAQFLLRQATSEKTALTQENDELKKKVDELTKAMADTKSDAAAKQESAEKRQTETVGKWRDANDKLVAQLNDTRTELQAQRKHGAELEQQLGKQTENFNLCYGNNKKLYEINGELLGRYEDKGFSDVLKQKEPFTGIKQVEVENLVQDYQYRLDELKLGEAPAAPATQK